MKKRIRLSENQLRRVIKEAVLNELDWKTYASAASKRKDQWDTLEKFLKNNGNNPHLPPRLKKTIENIRNKYKEKADALYDYASDQLNIKYGTKGPYTGKEHPNDLDRWLIEPYEHWAGKPYREGDEEYPSIAYRDDNPGHYDSNVLAYNYGQVRDLEGAYRPEYDDYENDADVKDVVNFQTGKSQYVQGKGWPESVIRRVTESVMRKLREGIDDEEDNYGENAEFVEYLADAIYDEAKKYAWGDYYEYLEDNPYESIPFNVKIKYQEGNTIIDGILKFKGAVCQDEYIIVFVGQDCMKKTLDNNGNPLSTEAYSLSEDILVAVGENLLKADGRDFYLAMWGSNGRWIYGFN